MKTYNKICDFLEKMLFWIVSLFGGVMIVITTTEVFRRYFFSLSFSWA
jgi:TRAP-type C4-dicarboxylate transport system permease small subunit